jgi:hypothetical protein
VGQVLILATPPDPARIPGAGWRVVSTSPWLSARLDAAGIGHRRALDYGPSSNWQALHAEAAGCLAALARRSLAPPDADWLDDWSHLLVDELRVPLFWFRVARGLLRVERPHAIHLQTIDPASGAAAAMAALALAFAALGRPCLPWPPAPS